MNAKKSPRPIAASLAEYWSPKVIAELDDHYVKVAKLSPDYSPPDRCEAVPGAVNTAFSRPSAPQTYLPVR